MRVAQLASSHSLCLFFPPSFPPFFLSLSHPPFFLSFSLSPSILSFSPSLYPLFLSPSFLPLSDPLVLSLIIIISLSLSLSASLSSPFSLCGFESEMSQRVVLLFEAVAWFHKLVRLLEKQGHRRPLFARVPGVVVQKRSHAKGRPPATPQDGRKGCPFTRLYIIIPIIYYY